MRCQALIQYRNTAARRFKSGDRRLTGESGRLRPEALTSVAAAAEELMSVGLALVLDNDVTALSEWLAPMRMIVRDRDNAADVGTRWILPPAAMLAVHGVGAVAWHRRRLDALRLLVEAQLDTPASWIYHLVLGDSSYNVLPWVHQELSASPVFARADQTIVATLDESLRDVGGFIVLRHFLGFSDAEVARWTEESQQGVFGGLWFPGLQHPAIKWCDDLGSLFSSGGSIETDVAAKIFDMSQPDFRARCARITRALAMSTARVEPYRRGWGMGATGTKWNAWCDLAEVDVPFATRGGHFSPTQR